ncbi:MAG: carboxypeptidase regulatory-like domain-containing protein [Gemmatimonadaceae bacterium]|nr:carboxypeptidase regulatory-like domain-containing protein [Gemmatimonadaceae bacterium]
MVYLMKACGLLVALAIALPVRVAAQGRIIGSVHDSVAAKPLASALVQLALVSDPSVSRSVRTDASGRFRLDSLPNGTWVVAVMHPRLDSLGIEQLMRTVSTHGGWEQPLSLAIPSVRTLVERVCDAAPTSDTSGYLHGRLRSIGGESGPGAGQVELQWVDLSLEVANTVGTRRIPRRLLVATRDDGSFVACGVPPGGTVRVRGIRGTDTTGIVETVIPDHGIARRDLAVGPVRHIAVTSTTAATDSVSSDSMPATEQWQRRGSGMLQGRIASSDGAPIPNASVVIRGVDLTARTDSSGRWQLRDLPQGTHTIEARALGYRAEQMLIDIGDPSVEALQTSLERVVALDTVRTRAMRETMFVPELRAFEQRRRQYPGYFRGPAELDQMQPFDAADIFRSMPSVRVEYGRYNTAIKLRGKAGIPCTPDIYLDQMRITPSMSEGVIDDWVFARAIRAVEVYSGVTGPPAEFASVFNECGVIVIWTARGR